MSWESFSDYKNFTILLNSLVKNPKGVENVVLNIPKNLAGLKCRGKFSGDVFLDIFWRPESKFEVSLSQKIPDCEISELSCLFVRDCRSEAETFKFQEATYTSQLFCVFIFPPSSLSLACHLNNPMSGTQTDHSPILLFKPASCFDSIHNELPIGSKSLHFLDSNWIFPRGDVPALLPTRIPHQQTMPHKSHPQLLIIHHPL